MKLFLVFIGIVVVMFLYILVTNMNIKSIEGACTNESDSNYENIMRTLSAYSTEDIIKLSIWIKKHALYHKTIYNGCYPLGKKTTYLNISGETEDKYTSLLEYILLEDKNVSRLNQISKTTINDLFTDLNNIPNKGNNYSFNECLESARKNGKSTFGISQSNVDPSKGKCFMSDYSTVNGDSNNNNCSQNSDNFNIGNNQSVGSYTISPEYEKLMTIIKYAEYAIDKEHKLNYCIMALNMLHCALTSLK